MCGSWVWAKKWMAYALLLAVFCSLEVIFAADKLRAKKRQLISARLPCRQEISYWHGFLYLSWPYHHRSFHSLDKADREMKASPMMDRLTDEDQKWRPEILGWTVRLLAYCLTVSSLLTVETKAWAGWQVNRWDAADGWFSKDIKALKGLAVKAVENQSILWLPIPLPFHLLVSHINNDWLNFTAESCLVQKVIKGWIVSYLPVGAPMKGKEGKVLRVSGQLNKGFLICCHQPSRENRKVETESGNPVRWTVRSCISLFTFRSQFAWQLWNECWKRETEVLSEWWIQRWWRRSGQLTAQDTISSNFLSKE